MARPKQESFEGWWCERDDALAILNMVKYRRLDLAQLVREVHSPAEAPAVFSRLAAEKTFPLVQFDWDLI